MALQPTVRPPTRSDAKAGGDGSQPVGADAASSRQDASPGLVLLIVCAGVVLASLDLFIVNVALPQMGRDFHLRGGGLGDLSWVLNGYAIVYAALLVLFGRIAERYPRERGFLLGVALFVAASAACGAASSLPMLVAFRVVQAAGAALLTPTSLGLVLASFPPEGRHGAVRTWTAVGGLAAALGPVIGGLLVEASWRWVFFVNVPIGLVALVVGWRRLPHVPGQPVSRPDALAALLVTVGVGLLSLGLVKGGTWGWDDVRTVATLAVAAARARAVRGAHRLESQPADRPGAVQAPAVHGRIGRGDPVLGLVRGDVALARAVGAGGLALVAVDHGSVDRARDR